MLRSMIIILRSTSVRKLCVYTSGSLKDNCGYISKGTVTYIYLPYPQDMNGLSESTKEITGVWATVMELNNPHKVWVVCDKKIRTLRTAIS
jgi:hypothetical protein